jgi:hypothetical protein
MTVRRWAVRLVCSVGGAVLFLILLALVAVQIQQRILRWRAERLSAEMHQIRLYQSTWADAQRLMRRWGAWGHYDGSCTPASCKYEIRMTNVSWYNPRVPRHAWLDWLLTHDRLNLYEWFGGRGSAFMASFTVHDGTIWREGTGIGVGVPRRRMKRITGPDTILDSDDIDVSLSLGAESYQRLHKTLENWMPFVGGAEGLAGHPYYKVGRPGGCMVNCEIGAAYFSTHTPPAEIERLTAYNFSCFTRFNPCAELEDLLPAATEWPLYPKQGEQQSEVASPEKPCDVPVWALARDARYVLAVEALSTQTEHHKEDYGEHRREVTKIRVVGSLKEAAPWLPSSIASAEQDYWLRESVPPNEDEQLIPGKRYLVFPVGNDRRDQLVNKDSPLRFERCGVQEDTPETRRELGKGFAQNDTLNP